jgi:ketosteroid isomerase-like protein
MPARTRLLVHRLYEALQARNYPALLDLLSPEIRITHSPALPWGGPFQGHHGAKQVFERLETHGSPDVAVEHPLGPGDQMAVTVWMGGSTRRTGWRLAVPSAYFWVFKNGLAVRLDVDLGPRTFPAALWTQPEARLSQCLKWAVIQDFASPGGEA